MPRNHNGENRVSTIKESTEGVVKFWNDEKGFGFVKAEGVDDDVFLHASDVLNREPGERVAFGKGDRLLLDVMRSDRGYRAQNVTRVV
jgi:CspA family cold shock protein